MPGPRCGHSLNIHADKIFLFGGLQEVTKESNETMKFNIETGTWEELGQSSMSTSALETIIPTENSKIEEASPSFSALVKKQSMTETIQPAVCSSETLVSPTQ